MNNSLASKMTIETKQHMFQARQDCEQCVLFMNILIRCMCERLYARFIPKQFENNKANRIGHVVQTVDLKYITIIIKAAERERETE